MIPETGIDCVEKIELGKMGQSILIQAEDRTNPVLLFVHGGPCMPVPGVVSRGQDYAICTMTKELVKHFVLVFWDQRGSANHLIRLSQLNQLGLSNLSVTVLN